LSGGGGGNDRADQEKGKGNSTGGHSADASSTAGL
jgi:hypothetical protein